VSELFDDIHILNHDKAAENIFRAKILRRKELANLSFKKKIETLIELQKMAKGVNRANQKNKRKIWTT